MREGRGEVTVSIRETTVEDVPLILSFIRDIAEFERLSDEVVTDEEILGESLFGENPAARVIIAEIDKEPAGFAVYFFNFSTFTGRPGIYIEDIFVSEDRRGLGVGETMLRYLARLAVKRKCERIEWAVLDWNPARSFYENLGAGPMNGWVLYRVTGKELEKLSGE